MNAKYSRFHGRKGFQRLNSLLCPGVSHDGSRGDGEFLAEVSAQGIGKKFVAFFPARGAGLEGFILVNFLAKVGNQVGGAQTQRRLAPPPEREAACRGGVVQAVGLHGGDQQRGVGCGMEGWLPHHGGIRPDLGLPDSQQVFLFLLIRLDLPSIEIGLQGLGHVHGGITDQKIGRPTIQRVSVSP